MSRGAKHWIDGPDEGAREIDLHPLLSGARSEDEGLFVMQLPYWQEQMIKAVEAEQAKHDPCGGRVNGHLLRSRA